MRPRPISLPEDGMPHDTVIEWWYWNGYLEDAKGKEYAFMDCLFRADAEKVKIPYLKNLFARGRAGRYVLFAHSILADLSAKSALKNIQNISFASRDSFKRPLFYASYMDPLSLADGFVAHEMAETAPGVFHIKTEMLDLTMRSRRTPMLEGGQGFVTVRGRESFYYSLTDLETAGMVRVGGKWVSVTGRSWMDHQWADVAYAKDRWTWFSIQLEDGTDIMCVEYDDGKAKDRIVDVLDGRGRTTHATAASFAPGDERWKSKVTKAEYPLQWTITVPEKDMTISTSARIADGEMIFGSINYWEGPIAVSATVKGKKVKGVGFMELAGYPSNYNYLLLAGKQVNSDVQRRIRDFLHK